MSKWPDDLVLVFQRMYVEGASYGVIAAQIRKSRSAVAGKVGRMHLTRVTSRGRQVLPNPTAGRPRNIKRRLLRPTPAPVVLSDPEVVFVSGRECDIWALDRTRCRYPHGEPRTASFHFCGQLPQEGSPYCAPHHKVTHLKTKGVTC